MNRKQLIDSMTAELIERIKKVPLEKWNLVHKGLNVRYWDATLLGEQPDWWCRLVFGRTPSFLENALPLKSKIFSFEVAVPALRFIESKLL